MDERIKYRVVVWGNTEQEALDRAHDGEWLDPDGIPGTGPNTCDVEERHEEIEGPAVLGLGRQDCKHSIEGKGKP
jgi:hypothetical protein